MPTLHETLDHLEKEQSINNRGQIEKAYTSSEFAATTHIAIQILSALSAIIAACFLIGSLAIAGALDSSTGMFIWGLLAFGVSFLLNRTVKSETTLSNFSSQASLALMVIAKGLITAAVIIYFDGNVKSTLWLVSLTLLLLTIITYGPYNMKLDRFFSPLAFIIALQTALTFNAKPDAIHTILPNLIFCLELALGVWLLIDGRFASYWRPLGIALLLFTTALMAMNTTLLSDFLREKSHLSPIVVKASISLALALTTYLIAKASNALHQPLIIVLAIAICAMALFGAEGIIAGLLILLLSCYKSDRVLLNIGIITLSYFIFSFYYDLDITLLQKSITLLASGGILLILAAYFHYKVSPRGAD